MSPILFTLNYLGNISIYNKNMVNVIQYDQTNYNLFMVLENYIIYCKKMLHTN